MGSIKLHMEPIVNTVNKIASKCAQINTSTFNNVMTLITLVCNSTTAKYEGDHRPRVRVTRDDIEQSFLYDTGAQRTCMPFKAFKRIYGTAKCKKLPETNLHIRDAGGNDLGYKGTYLAPMQVLGRKVMHDLVVLENVQDTILGHNFIKQHHLSYNSLSEKCFFAFSITDRRDGETQTHHRVAVNPATFRFFLD